ncbi:hypothetical protein Ahy_Scaffold1g107385 [Arachis hypogaea]|uniref:Tyrosine-protein kinase catalytic domain-containing protein n=1 Tax=Arachis hypogaea TaxID=3818 RepID=A0A444WVL1_ARAHY|nr:hypothetical protein Ahy_Scaffold1g107385 [Arachis hypogaea]
MTHCSADRVMLRRHSSSQVLPYGSKRLWCKMFLWSHRNIHRAISSKSTQVNPGVAVTHNPYGYSSDTLEPKHKQSPGNVEWLFSLIRLVCSQLLIRGDELIMRLVRNLQCKPQNLRSYYCNLETAKTKSLRLECFIKCKGVLRGGAEVAVKRISQENDGVREFLAEISSLGRLKQRNLVALRGWCKKDMGNFLLVYEYMDNGSLDKRVFCDESMMLNCEERIRNIKEVMCGRRPMEEGKPPLVEFVWGLMVKGELMNALDERLSAKGDFNLQQVEKVLQLGLLCAYPEPKSRPNMRQVVSILEGNNEGGEESENENADTCLLLNYSTHPTFEDIRQSNTSSMYPRDGKLFVNVVSVESGKAIAKSSKVLVQNGSCQWSDKHIEIINT